MFVSHSRTGIEQHKSGLGSSVHCVVAAPEGQCRKWFGWYQMTSNKLRENTVSLSVTHHRAHQQTHVHKSIHKHFRDNGRLIRSDSPNSIYHIPLVDYIVAVSFLLRQQPEKDDTLDSKFLQGKMKIKNIIWSYKYFVTQLKEYTRTHKVILIPSKNQQAYIHIKVNKKLYKWTLEWIKGLLHYVTLHYIGLYQLHRKIET